MFPSLSKVILDFLNLTDNLDCGNHYEYLDFNEMILQAFLLLQLFNLEVYHCFAIPHLASYILEPQLRY